MAILKKIWVLFFCLQIGFSNHVLEEFFHFPSLIRHYLEHIQKEPVSIVDFIQLHYTENEHQQQKNPDHHHGSLPFHHSYTNVPALTFTIPDSLTIEFEKLTDTDLKNNLSGHSMFYPDNIGKTHWHPPQTA